jgi:hypothetical protein
MEGVVYSVLSEAERKPETDDDDPLAAFPQNWHVYRCHRSPFQTFRTETAALSIKPTYTAITCSFCIALLHNRMYLFTHLLDRLHPDRKLRWEFHQFESTFRPMVPCWKPMSVAPMTLRHFSFSDGESTFPKLSIDLRAPLV